MLVDKVGTVPFFVMFVFIALDHDIKSFEVIVLDK